MKWKDRPDQPGAYWASRDGIVTLVHCGGLSGWVRCIYSRNQWLTEHYDGFMGPLPEPPPLRCKAALHVV